MTRQFNEFYLGLYNKKCQLHGGFFLLKLNDFGFQLVKGRLNYKLTQDFSLQYSLTRLMFEPDPEGETTWIHVIRATNYFTNDLFIKVFYQINSAIDKKNIQVLFVYRFQPPFGFIQLAYQKGTARFGERGTQGHALFLKIAYMF